MEVQEKRRIQVGRKGNLVGQEKEMEDAADLLAGSTLGDGGNGDDGNSEKDVFIFFPLIFGTSR